MADITITEAQFPTETDLVREIFREYAAGLGVDLCFQDFEAELAALPGKYAPPQGRLLLARRDGDVAGCVALRPQAGDVCEMKRLYVRPAARGLGLGRRLAEAACAAAREAGYARIRLDTLPDMAAAQSMYASMGFRPIPAYVFNPVAGVRYLERDLAAR
jgi:ribosomal protein S18 acetylase RimI-like enzyme